MRPGRSSRRSHSFQGSVLFRISNGKTYAQAWPRKRGLPQLTYQRANLERMKVAQRAVRYVPGWEISTMEDGLQRFMNAHRGVRGTAAIRLRDWIMQALYGRAWNPVAPDGRVFYTSKVYRECSDFLDWLDPRPGSLVVRTDHAWLCTVQCKAGSFLMLTEDGDWPGGCPEASIPSLVEAVGGTI